MKTCFHCKYWNEKRRGCDGDNRGLPIECLLRLLFWNTAIHQRQMNEMSKKMIARQNRLLKKMEDELDEGNEWKKGEDEESEDPSPGF